MTTKTTSSKKSTTKGVTKKASKASKAAKKTTKTASVAAKKITTKATKKTASKATKKAAKKAPSNQTTRKRPLVHAPNEHSFWTTDGQVLNSIVALNEALGEMQDAVYQYHVDKDRHDFADWVESVLDDPECAAALRLATTPKKARTVVVRHLKLYQL